METSIKTNGEKIAKGAIALAAGLTTGYAAYLLIRSKKKEIKEIEHDVKDWATEHFEEVKKGLELEVERSKEVFEEVKICLHDILFLLSLTRTMTRLDREAIGRAMEDRFVKMKNHIHEVVKPSDPVHVKILNKFYEGLADMLFRTHGNHVH